MWRRRRLTSAPVRCPDWAIAAAISGFWRRLMDCGARSLKVLATMILAAAAAAPLSVTARADDQCSGHQLLSTPRQEQSCQIVVPQVFDSPDGKIHALVYPDDISLYATPDMESRVVFRSGAGDTLTSQDL